MIMQHSDKKLIALAVVAILFMIANAMDTALFYTCLMFAIAYSAAKICIKG